MKAPNYFEHLTPESLPALPLEPATVEHVEMWTDERGLARHASRFEYPSE